MRIFITAGNTQTPVDRVRCITNIFTGRTGARIAAEAYRRGHRVTLATSHPETVDLADADPSRWRVIPYRTFDDLENLMASRIPNGEVDAIVHCAAVGDYHVAGVFAPAPTTRFDADGAWRDDAQTPRLIDRMAGKVSSDEPELWLRLTRAPKLVDRIRSDWGFRGILVKFKLEVGMDQDALQGIAERSRAHSQADWMVANTLEGAGAWAIVGNADGYARVRRDDLASSLLDRIEGGSRHG